MGSNLVVVAIPDENDRVWTVSSEKVPHLTLLFLGEADGVKNVDKIVEFVQHAASTTLKRFYLPVDRRDVLGDDKADVLFFKTKRYYGKEIKDFRATLLQDPNIRTAYDSAEQFEGPWKPHLTLGYPESPAKNDDTDRDQGFYDVAFTKIAVWTGDYDGPELVLKDWDDEEDLHGSVYDTPMAAWSGLAEAGQEAVAHLFGKKPEELEHHGVKGMKWGVRKTETVSVNGKTKMVTPKKAEKLDKKFQTKVNSFGTFIELHNKAAEGLNKETPAFNQRFVDKYGKEKIDSGVLFNNNDPITKEYYGAYNKLFLKHLNAAAASMGTSPTGKFKVAIRTEHDESLTEFGWEPKVEKVRHAATDDTTDPNVLEFVAEQDEQGRILSVKPLAEEDAVAHAALQGMAFVEALIAQDDELEHYGIKGMRWGIRKDPPEAVAPTAESKVPHGAKRKTKVVVEGGENHPAHEDAIKVAEAKAKLAKSGPAALSNSELREVANRVQLEQQVAVLTSRKGKQFVTRELQNEGKNLARQGVRSGLKKGAKKAAAVALI